MKNKVLLFLCVCSILILIDVQKNKEGEKNPMYQNMVNSDFSIALNQTNSSVEFANSILSRDSIYVVCFDLTKEYTHSLEESTVFQNGNITDLLQQYVEPWIALTRETKREPYRHGRRADELPVHELPRGHDRRVGGLRSADRRLSG